MQSKSCRNSYNHHYLTSDHFSYRVNLYRPFLQSLLKNENISIGSLLLDVGCGQGFFSNLLHDLGLRVIGVDFSEVAIIAAYRAYNSPGIDFIVADALSLPFKRKFDYVFTRSLSLYNTLDFSFNSTVTAALMEYVRPGGAFIFVYNSNLARCNKGGQWRNHSLNDVFAHFEAYSPSVYFISRVDCVALGCGAFSTPVTLINAWLSKRLALGGEIVCIIKKL